MGIQKYYNEATNQWEAIDSGAINDGTVKFTPTDVKNIDDKVGSLTAQLAQKAQQDDVYLKVNGINVNDFDEPTRQTFLESQGIDVNYVLGEGNVKTINLADKVVTATKTTFTKLGKNKFEGTYIGGSLSGYDGLFTETAGAQSAVLKLEKGKTYTASKGEGGNHFRVGTFIGKPNFGDIPLRLVGNSALATECTFTLQGDEDYIVIYVKTPSGDTTPTYLQVEEGSIATPFSEPKVIIDLDDQSVDFRKITGVNTVALLCGQSSGFDVNLVDKKIVTLAATGFVRIGSKEYRLKDGEWDYSHITSQTIFICFDTVNSDILFLTLADMRSGWNYLNPIIGVIRQNDNTVWINGIYSLEGKAVKPYTGESGESEEVKFSMDYITNDLPNEIYRTNTEFITVDPNAVHQDIYNRYDGLMSQYPNYITRTEIARSTGDYPIYRYDFNPDHSDNFNEMKIPKILYQTGLHGHEKMSVMSGYRFFKDMCENWRDNEVLRALRFNVHFVVIPMANPSGYDLSQRKSASGVDLNRNFPVGWTANEDTESPYYPGTESLSEPETQAIYNLISNEENLIFCIDHHNSQTFEGSGGWDSYYFWVNTSKPNTKKFLFGLANQMSYHGIVDNDVLDETRNYGALARASNGGTFTITFETIRLATTLEVAQMILSDSQYTQKYNVESIGNTFIAVLKNYEFIKSDVAQ